MAEERPISWLSDLIIIMFVIFSFFAAISMIRDPTYHIVLTNSKDLPLVHDATLASPYNINTTFILPNSTKLVFDQFNRQVGLVKIDKTEKGALSYPIITNKNLGSKLDYKIEQPKTNKTGEFNITIKNE